MTTEKKKRAIKEQSVEITERVGRLFRAATDAYVEVATGAVETVADTATKVARTAGETLSEFVSKSTEVTQRGVERFFDVLNPETDSTPPPHVAAAGKDAVSGKSPA